MLELDNGSIDFDDFFTHLSGSSSGLESEEKTP